MKNTELQKLADSIIKQIQCHFLNTNVSFVMPEDTSFMEKFTKDVWSLCRLSLGSEKWRKVSEELPNDNIDVLVKIDIQGYIHYDVDRIIYGEWCNGDDGIIEWKLID